jgi:hypothetical protein
MPLTFHLLGALAALPAWLPANRASAGMMLLGLALLIAILLRRSFRYYGRRGTTRDAPAEYLTQTPRPASNHRSLSSAPADVLRWQVEMHETARDLKAELDSKMRLLQLLVAQAREQAERLEALLQQLGTDAREKPRTPRDRDRTP